jgi:hypothetical protein
MVFSRQQMCCGKSKWDARQETLNCFLWGKVYIRRPSSVLQTADLQTPVQIRVMISIEMFEPRLTDRRAL